MDQIQKHHRRSNTAPNPGLRNHHHHKVVLDEHIIANAKNLKLVLLAATGTDNVNLESCSKRSITVCNVRNYATAAVAQHTMALILNLLTNQLKYHQDTRSGMWNHSEVFCMLHHPIMECEGKNLGIIGYGTLGRKVAQLAQAFGMRILLCQRPGTKASAEANPERVPFEQLLAQSDVISIHCPLTQQTRHLFGPDEFAAMKVSAILVNTARGAIIDSAALVNALRQGQIGGAGIDVLDQEPPEPNHILCQADIPNLILTPHNAWGSRESRQRLIHRLGENLGRWLQGTPVNVVG